MEKILIGSTYFFSNYSDFSPKDIDELELIDTNEFRSMQQITGQGKCLFKIKRYQTKDVYIKYALKSDSGMVIGKFLIPEFCKLINFTIKDLPKLQPLLERLDDKHKYEEIIFKSYLENGDFKLTQKQLDLAYDSYKNSRQKG